MAKAPKTIFVCNECGYESAKWMGKCPACNSWNTFFEQKIEKITENGVKISKERNTPKALNSYKGEEVARLSSGFGELDRVLGGGIVIYAPNEYQEGLKSSLADGNIKISDLDKFNIEYIKKEITN